MTCAQRGITYWRKFCSRVCYHEWRIGKSYGAGVRHDVYRQHLGRRMHRMWRDEPQLAAHRLQADDEREAIPSPTALEIHSGARRRLPSSLCKPSLRTHFDWDDSGNADYANRPILLDLFAGAGGAGFGYYLAGFRVVGVDINPQPRYPFEFIQADAMTFPLEGFDAIHASPPCQGYSVMRHLPWNRDREYPMLIADVRLLLAAMGVPYVIENVEGAKKHMQAGWLCGTMFTLPFYRHRLFETNFFWLQPGHPNHEWRIRPGHTLAGRARQVGFTERYTKTGRPAFGFDKVGSGIGHGGGAVLAREAMGVEWMSRDESSQAIPPAYTEFIGRQLMAALERAS